MSASFEVSQIKVGGDGKLPHRHAGKQEASKKESLKMRE